MVVMNSETLTPFFFNKSKTPFVICTAKQFYFDRTSGFHLEQICEPQGESGSVALHYKMGQTSPGSLIRPARFPPGRNSHGAAGTTSAGLPRVTVTAGGGICWRPVAPPKCTLS